jgi:asparagine synthase (glutamine-hydrolysing)
MCGINGIFSYHYAANPVDQHELVRTRDHMAARGPDGQGLWLSDDLRLGFGHRRLAIIELSEAGAQPMTSLDGALVVTFNGEIYNYRELRASLEARGRRFRTQSDTEVLLHLYAEKGADMVHDLRGMFAFAIWDANQRRLFLARDPLGIKPLYYADDGWTFRFASQVKALQAGGAIASTLDPAGCVGFYSWGSVPEPCTQLLAVRCLPAGCHLVVDGIGAHTPSRYFSVAALYCEAEAATKSASADAVAILRSALLDSVRHHLVSDVPVGVFLSAGIDSGALVGLMRDAGQQDIQSVTIAFDEFINTDQDESPLAEQLARHYGIKHSRYVVTRREFEDDVPRIMSAMDQPTVDGINMWFVSKAAAALGLKVSISGLGGDELFGGYPSFQDIPRWVRRLAVPSRIPGLGKVFERLFTTVPRSWHGANPKAASMVSLGGTYAGAYRLRRGLFMPHELRQLMDPDFVSEGMRRLKSMGLVEQALEPCPRSNFAKVAALETQLYMRNQLLRDTDWASMAHSLEVRVPLVDATLLRTVAMLHSNGSAPPTKRSLAVVPSTPLPAAIVDRSKTGFATPIAQWQSKLPSLEGRGLGKAATASTPWARRWAMRVAAMQTA